MKNVILGWFWLIWLSVNLGLTRGILVNLTWNSISSALISEGVAPRQSKCFRSPLEKRKYFWNFRGLACKWKADKIQCLQLPLLYLTSRVQWEVLDNECDSVFCCPKIACRNCVVHGLRSVLPDTVKLLQLIRKNFSDLVLGTGQQTLSFFFLVKGQSINVDQVNIDRRPL